MSELSHGRTPARILYIEGNRDGTIGGSFFSLLFLTSRLDRSRFEPIVIFCADNSLIPRFSSAGIQTRVLAPGQPVSLPTILGRLIAKVVNFAKGFIIEPLRLARWLRREQVIVVHLNNSIISNHVWMMAARLAGVACLTHERGINADFPRRARWLARRLDAVICISNAVRDNYVRLGLGTLPLVTIPNGLDPRDMQVSRPPESILRELGIAPDRQLVGVVGNIKRWKGQDVMIRALARIVQFHDNVVCLIIGDSAEANRAYRQEIQVLINSLGLRGRVVFTSYRSNVADFINVLDVLVHTSVLPEPFGRVLLEGMSFSKPIVASRGGAVPEIILDGETGLLFDPGDDAGLAACLEQLLTDKGRAAEMGRAGHARLLENFGIDRNVAATEDLYERILARRRLGHTRGKPNVT